MIIKTILRKKNGRSCMNTVKVSPQASVYHIQWTRSFPFLSTFLSFFSVRTMMNCRIERSYKGTTIQYRILGFSQHNFSVSKMSKSSTISAPAPIIAIKGGPFFDDFVYP